MDWGNEPFDTVANVVAIQSLPPTKNSNRNDSFSTINWFHGVGGRWRGNTHT